MMSKKQWFVLLCIYLCYILFGAFIFYIVEHKEEEERLLQEKQQRLQIEGLIRENYSPNKEYLQNEIFQRLSAYCNKPLGGVAPFNTTLTWTFYHAVFFVMTIISTIGYGNLSPTTPITRAFMILYGVIGIPINGIVIITLGNFFGKTYFKLYKRWKHSHIQRPIATVGFIGESLLYIIPGFLIFIIVPSFIIVLYEEWPYDLAIEFAFATLTTVGIGSIVPGTDQKHHSDLLFAIYKIFLLFWIISGLGYLAMIFGFISRGLQSKKMRKLEHKLAQNLKRTNKKIRQELRSILNEHLLLKVKRVYRERRTCALSKCTRTQSCPELRTYEGIQTPKSRRRAYSECVKEPFKSLERTQSDTDLNCIDIESTFQNQIDSNSSNRILQKMARALGNYENLYYNVDEVGGDIRKCADQILNIDYHQHFTGFSKTRSMQERMEKQKYGKVRSRGLPPIQQPINLFTRARNKFSQYNNEKETDIEKQISVESETICSTTYEQLSSFSALEKERLLEETSLADFLRALTSLDAVTVLPYRKYGTAIAPRKRRKAIAISSNLTNRKISLMPNLSPTQEVKERRLSLSMQSTIEGTKNEHSSAKAEPLHRSEGAQRPKRISWQYSKFMKNKHA